MDDTLKWIIAIVVILALLGLALLLWTRKNGDRRRAKAESIRMEARESAAELAERQARAKEAEATAERARVDAERASREAEAEHLRADEHRSEVDEKLRAADAVDPNVDHRADDYEPDVNRLHQDDPAYREDTTQREDTTTQEFERGDDSTRR